MSKVILETIDMDSYRVEVKEALKIAVSDEDSETAWVEYGNVCPDAKL